MTYEPSKDPSNPVYGKTDWSWPSPHYQETSLSFRLLHCSPPWPLWPSLATQPNWPTEPLWPFQLIKRIIKTINAESAWLTLSCFHSNEQVGYYLWCSHFIKISLAIRKQSRAPLIRWPLAAKPRSTLLSSLVLTRGWLSSSSILLLFHHHCYHQHHHQQQYDRAKICLLYC